MSKGTDKEIFGEDDLTRVQTNGSKGGRPSINRDLARRLFQAKFSSKQVAKRLSCHVNTARTIRRELEEQGLLDSGERDEGLNIVQADFEAECRLAVGISFEGWIKKDNLAYRRIFNFCQRTWVNVWDRPSLVLTKDRDNQLGDQLCMKFLDVFGEDDKRIRSRKKLIRYLFRFLGRMDLCDRYLRVKEGKDKRAIKRIPQIDMAEFPSFVQLMLDHLNTVKPQVGLASEFKIVTMMRTGDRNRDRGLMGLKIGAGNPSYIIMNSVDDFRIHVVEKKGDEWDITWVPRYVRERIWELYQTRAPGESLFSFNVKTFRSMVKAASLEFIGIEFIPHDLRKISITWLWVMGVPLELAVMLNVGWRDMSTAQKHYVHMRGLLRKTDRLNYREKIGAWYKDGLDEYTEEK